MKTAQFKKEFEALTRIAFGKGDRHTFYSRKQWDEDRGEKYGTGAVLNCVIEESGWYMVLNGYCDDSMRAGELAGQLIKLGQEHGIWYEMGYAWSLHWYPL